MGILESNSIVIVMVCTLSSTVQFSVLNKNYFSGSDYRSDDESGTYCQLFWFPKTHKKKNQDEGMKIHG